MDKRLRDIEIVIQDGQRPKGISRLLMAFLYIFLIFGILFITISIGMIFDLIFDSFDSEEFNAVIICCIFGAGLVTAAAILIKYSKRLYKNVLIWLKDAARLQAYIRDVYDVYAPNYIRIEINFVYADKGYTRSTKYAMGGYKYRYSHALVDILYSPKYDRVMILKEPSERRVYFEQS